VIRRCLERGPTAVRRRRDDAGQSAVEFMGVIPLLVLGVLAALQLTFAVAAIQATSAAARAGARAESRQPGTATFAAQQAVPSWLSGDLQVAVTQGGAGAEVTVSTAIPSVLPIFAGPTVTRSAWFEADHGPTPWG
jgi:Flp pilus assembly protein TadG